MTDRRILRTRQALHTAVLKLARKKSIAEITVSDLARAAAINRVTFYKHYSCPAEALYAALHDEISLLCNEKIAGVKNSELFNRVIYAIVEHIESRRGVYRRSFRQEPCGVAERVLAAQIAQVTYTYLTKRRKQRPPLPDIDFDVAAAYIANGITGALRLWLVEADAPRERLFENLHLLLPEWFSR